MNDTTSTINNEDYVSTLIKLFSDYLEGNEERHEVTKYATATVYRLFHSNKPTIELELAPVTGLYILLQSLPALRLGTRTRLLLQNNTIKHTNLDSPMVRTKSEVVSITHHEVEDIKAILRHFEGHSYKAFESILDRFSKPTTRLPLVFIPATFCEAMEALDAGKKIKHSTVNAGTFYAKSVDMPGLPDKHKVPIVYGWLESPDGVPTQMHQDLKIHGDEIWEVEI